MPKLAWITDIHLDFVTPEVFDAFMDALRETEADAILLGGDIAEAPTLIECLEHLDRSLNAPLYFVLGNHDFYRGSIPAVRKMVTDHCRDHDRLQYLSDGPVVAISDEVALIGHDGWADARSGDYQNSQIMLTDYRLIDELAPFYLEKAKRQQVLQSLGEQAAQQVRESLTAALQQFPRVVFLTHAPPLREACWHDGHVSDDQWAPHFVCQAVGEVLLSVMREHPEHQLTVLCGHTHSDGFCQPLPNLEIYTGKAEYRLPEIQRCFDF